MLHIYLHLTFPGRLRRLVIFSVTGKALWPGGPADTPTWGSPPPRPERMHHRQPRLRGLLLHRLLLRALPRYPAGLHQDLHRPPKAAQAGQH